MFEQRRKRNKIQSAWDILALIYHNTVRSIRSSHRNALIAILLNLLQMVILVGSFYVLFTVLGMRGSSIRGDFLLYIMTGVFLYITHIRTVRAVYKAEGPTSGMMQHAPMNTAISIFSSAFGSLYTQFLSVVVVLYVYHAGWGPITLYNWQGAFGMFMTAWFFGVGVGVLFSSMNPWIPELMPRIQLIYTRATMITSGKMFVANAMPSYMVDWFDWNPLFHSIDQIRGFVFINYFPHHSSVLYPLWGGLILVLLGFMLEHFTRKRTSVSWAAGR